jgi:outer membrane protein assembly factor BamE (lipoprotein component of BamABCDE complex)
VHPATNPRAGPCAAAKKGMQMQPTTANSGKTATVSALVALVLVFALAACQPIMRYHGYAPLDADLAQIVVGRDTRETVAEKIGRPGVGGVMENSGWYYVQSDWLNDAWRAPVELDRQVVAISFNERGVVSNVERFGLEDGEIVTLSRRITESGPRGQSVLRQIFGTLGRFTTANL